MPVTRGARPPRSLRELMQRVAELEARVAELEKRRRPAKKTDDE